MRSLRARGRGSGRGGGGAACGTPCGRVPGQLAGGGAGCPGSPSSQVPERPGCLPFRDLPPAAPARPPAAGKGPELVALPGGWAQSLCIFHSPASTSLTFGVARASPVGVGSDFNFYFGAARGRRAVVICCFCCCFFHDSEVVARWDLPAADDFIWTRFPAVNAGRRSGMVCKLLFCKIWDFTLFFSSVKRPLHCSKSFLFFFFN